ncbi:hypothetical protein V6N13_047459 [Hibiscus sabdariffa]|uniref:Uncharacterized protein n=1 Tax=Hibiscus sabdariffa TaxID=183260 RepID=A0ABR2F481_9ROSI
MEAKVLELHDWPEEGNQFVTRENSNSSEYIYPVIFVVENQDPTWRSLCVLTEAAPPPLACFYPGVPMNHPAAYGAYGNGLAPAFQQPYHGQSITATGDCSNY